MWSCTAILYICWQRKYHYHAVNATRTLPLLLSRCRFQAVKTALPTPLSYIICPTAPGKRRPRSGPPAPGLPRAPHLPPPNGDGDQSCRRRTTCPAAILSVPNLCGDGGATAPGAVRIPGGRAFGSVRGGRSTGVGEVGCGGPGRGREGGARAKEVVWMSLGLRTTNSRVVFARLHLNAPSKSG